MDIGGDARTTTRADGSDKGSPLSSLHACDREMSALQKSRPRLSTIPTALPLLTLWMLYACKQTRQVDTDAGNSSERLRVLTDTIEAGAGHGSVLGLDQLEVRFVLLAQTGLRGADVVGRRDDRQFVCDMHHDHGAEAIGQQGR